MRFLCTASASVALWCATGLCAGASVVGQSAPGQKAADTVVFHGVLYDIACIPSLVPADAGRSLAVGAVALAAPAPAAGPALWVTLGECAVASSAPASGGFYQIRDGRSFEVHDTGQVSAAHVLTYVRYYH